MAVNFFALSEEFTTVKPKYYVISDPMFFRRAGYSPRIESLYEALKEKVDWKMKLYVQYYNPEHFDYRTAIGHNPNIEIVPFHSTVFRGFRSVEFWCYRRARTHARTHTHTHTQDQNQTKQKKLLSYVSHVRMVPDTLIG